MPTATAVPVVIAYPFISADLPTAAAATGVSETTLREAIEVGDLTARYVGRKATKPIVAADDLHAWVQSLPVQRGRAS